MYHASAQGVDECMINVNILITPKRGKDKEDMFQSHTRTKKTCSTHTQGQRRHVLITHKDKEDMF